MPDHIRAADALPAANVGLLTRLANIGVREGWYALPPSRTENRAVYQLTTADPKDSPGENTGVHRIIIGTRVGTGSGLVYAVEKTAGELTGDGPGSYEHHTTVEYDEFGERDDALGHAAQLARR